MLLILIYRGIQEIMYIEWEEQQGKKLKYTELEKQENLQVW